MNDTEMAQAVERMFQEMQTNGISLDQDFLWGYFFIDPNRGRLKNAADSLKHEGYTIVGIKRVCWFPQRFLLHIDKTEKHDRDSLNRRNRQLAAFAKENNISCYEGMDVGPSDGHSSFQEFSRKTIDS